MEIRINSDRVNATIVGILFVLAALTSMIGLKLYDPVLTTPDYLVKGFENKNQVILGVFFELMLVVSAAGTAFMLYPYLKKKNEGLALGYFCFRLIETVIIIIGIVSILSLLTLSHEYVKATSPDITFFQTVGTLLKSIHAWSFMLGPNFMLGINTMICSYLLYKSILVPRFVAIMGITGALCIFIAALLEMFTVFTQLSFWGILLAIPVFAYEMTLASRLIFKGFNLPAITN